MSEENNHIEDFFRKHLDVEQDSFLEDDWAKMESKLTAAGIGVSDPTFLTATKIIIGAIIIALLSFGTGWWMNKRLNHNQTSQPARQTIQTNNNAAAITGNEFFECIYEGPTQSKAKLDEQSQSLVDVTKKFKKEISGDDMLLEEMSPIILYAYFPKHLSPIKSDSNDSLDLELTVEKLKSEPEIKPEREKAEIQWKNWAIGASIAPDFNSIGLFEQKQATGKVGLRVFWEFLPRATIQAGVFYNHKKYTASGEDYHPPYGYWASKTDGKIPTVVNGSCRVIDIPIYLSYRVAETKRWRFGAFTGLSNYIMLDQEYKYQFDQPYNGSSSSWSSDENLTLKWSVLNLGVSAEYFINRQLSISLEPYMQAPLQQIGWANVSLFGTGALFTLKKNLLPKQFFK